MWPNMLMSGWNMRSQIRVTFVGLFTEITSVAYTQLVTMPAFNVLANFFLAFTWKLTKSASKLSFPVLIDAFVEVAQNKLGHFWDGVSVIFSVILFKQIDGLSFACLSIKLPTVFLLKQALGGHGASCSLNGLGSMVHTFVGFPTFSGFDLFAIIFATTCDQGLSADTCYASWEINSEKYIWGVLIVVCEEFRRKNKEHHGLQENSGDMCLA